MFGVGGGGLAGRRVRERWRGVEEFGFVEIGAGTKATLEEAEDLKVARERYQARKKKGEAEAEQEEKDKEGDLVEGQDEGKEKSEQQIREEVEKDRMVLEEKLLGLHLDSAPKVTDSPRQSLDQAPGEKDIAQASKPPSLTVRLVYSTYISIADRLGDHRRTRLVDSLQD